MVNKQDRQVVRTAADLERKYDLASIAGIKKAVKNSEVNINKTNRTLENFISATLGSIDELQNQIDGNITTWFYNGVPTLENLPANEWTTDEDKANHIGDLYYDRDTGYAYRFMLSDTYEWLKLSDSDVIEALALANAASDTADSKRRVFTDTPYPPYDNGDLWFKDGDIYICQISKGKEETYAERDFIIATKYTDDTVAKQVGDELTIVKGTVTEIKEGVDQFKVSITETIKMMDKEIETSKAEIDMNSQQIKLIINKGTSDESVIYFIDEKPTMNNYPADTFCIDKYYPYEEDDPNVMYPGDLTWEFSDESYALHYNDFAYNETSGEAYAFTKNNDGYLWNAINDKSKLGYILSSISSITANIDGVNIQASQTKKNLQDNYYTKTETEAKINVKSEAIQLAVDAEVERASGEEKKLAAALELKVDTDELVSQLNMSADDINIEGDRFSLKSTNTQIEKDGKLTVKEAEVSGNIKGSTIIGSKVKSYSNNEEQGFAGASGVYLEDGKIVFAGYQSATMFTEAYGFFDTTEAMIYLSNLCTESLKVKGTGCSSICGYLTVGGISDQTRYQLMTAGNSYVAGNFSCAGTKNRIVDTSNYGQILLNAYETATPMFGDVGIGKLDENSECIIFIDDIFLETIDTISSYEVFLQKYGKGDIWVESIYYNHFVVKGDAPGLRFAWEIKGKQLEYSQYRLETEISNNYDSELIGCELSSTSTYEEITQELSYQYELEEFENAAFYENVDFEDTSIYEF